MWHICHLCAVRRSNALWTATSFPAAWPSCRSSPRGRSTRNWVLQRTSTTASMNHTSCQARKSRKGDFNLTCCHCARKKKQRKITFLIISAAVGFKGGVHPKKKKNNQSLSTRQHVDVRSTKHFWSFEAKQSGSVHLNTRSRWGLAIPPSKKNPKTNKHTKERKTKIIAIYRLDEQPSSCMHFRCGEC